MTNIEGYVKGCMGRCGWGGVDGRVHYNIQYVNRWPYIFKKNFFNGIIFVKTSCSKGSL